MNICIRKLAVAAVVLALTGPGYAFEPPEPWYVFVDVNVLPMSGPVVLTHQTVLVRGGRIAAVAPADKITLTPDVVRIDGRGKYLMPGLSDMHAHITPSEPPGTTAELLLYLASGVTTLRNMAGFPGHLPLRQAIKDGAVLGPRLYTTSPLLEGEDAVWDFSVKVLNAEEARTRVREYAQQGWDFIKVYHTLSAEAYAAVIEEARAQGIRVVGHVPFTVGIEEVLADGQSSVEHLRGYDIDGLSPDVLAIGGGRSPQRFASWLSMSDERMADLARQTAHAGTWNTPTLVVNMMLADFETLPEMAKHPMAVYLTPEMLGMLEENPLEKIFSPESRAMLGRVLPQQYKFIKALHDAGAPLMIGTDTFPSLVPGFTVIDEIDHFVKAGLSPYDALFAATVAPSVYLGQTSADGTVTAGQETDLILLDANPLEDTNNLWQLEGVMVHGRWLLKSELLSMITAELLRAASKPAPTQ
ncbi:MAG: hypothetical protein EXR85_06735 [Xanthomonadales bacterium]|nr:hypothetical protein [Xanthomonadales bacterium]